MKVGIKYVIRWRLFLPIASLVLSFLPVSATPEPFSNEGITSYTEAIQWVQKNNKGETFKPKSACIYKMVYFPEGQYMLIYFQSQKHKAYLYCRVPKSLWIACKNAPSTGRFYHTRIKGKKTFSPKLSTSHPWGGCHTYSFAACFVLLMQTMSPESYLPSK